MSHKKDVEGHKKIVAELYKKFGRWVQVGRYKYKVRFQQTLSHEGQEVLGLCDPVAKILYISLQGSIADTLIHEIGHAEICESGLRQRPDWDINNEEQVVELLGAGIAHNFELVRRQPSGSRRSRPQSACDQDGQ